MLMCMSSQNRHPGSVATENPVDNLGFFQASGFITAQLLVQGEARETIQLYWVARHRASSGDVKVSPDSQPDIAPSNLAKSIRRHLKKT